MPLVLCTGLVATWGGAALLSFLGLVRAGHLVSNGHGALGIAGLLYLLVLEIPHRRLTLHDRGVTLDGWRIARYVAWPDVIAVQPGFAGFFAVNRQLPSAAVIVLRDGPSLRIPDVFTIRRAELVRQLQQAWEAGAERAGTA